MITETIIQTTTEVKKKTTLLFRIILFNQNFNLDLQRNINLHKVLRVITSTLYDFLLTSHVGLRRYSQLALKIQLTFKYPVASYNVKTISVTNRERMLIEETSISQLHDIILMSGLTKVAYCHADFPERAQTSDCQINNKKKLGQGKRSLGAACTNCNSCFFQALLCKAYQKYFEGGVNNKRSSWL